MLLWQSSLDSVALFYAQEWFYFYFNYIFMFIQEVGQTNKR
jgi:hypothetical protein